MRTPTSAPTSEEVQPFYTTSRPFASFLPSDLCLFPLDFWLLEQSVNIYRSFTKLQEARNEKDYQCLLTVFEEEVRRIAGNEAPRVLGYFRRVHLSASWRGTRNFEKAPQSTSLFSLFFDSTTPSTARFPS
jgi:hypothetical protein